MRPPAINDNRDPDNWSGCRGLVQVIGCGALVWAAIILAILLATGRL